MSIAPLPPPIWVDQPASLEKLVKHLSQQPSIAVDTEANSLHAYHERVCLMQFSTAQQDFLVDPLNLVDLSSLAGIFANPAIEKIFHAAEYDVYLLEREFNFNFSNIFDTQVAARTLGYPATGLGAILAEKFDVQLDKHFQKANWGQRPLPGDLIDYARMDTHHLLALRDLLYQELKEKERWELAHEDFHRCCTSNGHNNVDPRERWERISGNQDLTAREKTILHELCLARERLAEKLDRPLFKVIDDRLLLALAQKAPSNRQKLKETGLSDRQIDRFGKIVLDAVRKGQQAPLVKPTRMERPPEAMLNRLQRLKNWRKRAAKEMGVESDVILPKPYLHALAEQHPRTLESVREILAPIPWRMEKFGAEIAKAIGIRAATSSPGE